MNNIKRIQAALAEKNLDAVLVTDEKNQRYACGFPFTDGAVIVKLKRNTPQRVRMFIWLEGQDIDCRSSGTVRASELALKIELAGSTK